MSGFTTPDGQRFTIFGEGGGQLLADELDVPLLGKIPLSEELREHADSGTPLSLADPTGRGVDRDSRRGARDHRRHAAGAARDAGRVAGRAGAGADRRHRAARGPGLGLTALDPLSRSTAAWWDERVADPRRRAAFYDVEASAPGASRSCGRSSSRRSATWPASGSPTCSATSASTRSPGRARGPRSSGSTSPSPAVEAARQRSPRRPGSTDASSQADVYDAVDGARWRALRHRLHGPRRAQLASRPAALGRCRRSLLTPGGFLYLAEFHPFTWMFADEELDDRARLLPPP